MLLIAATVCGIARHFLTRERNIEKKITIKINKIEALLLTFFALSASDHDNDDDDDGLTGN